jgi:hypothetical protein
MDFIGTKSVERLTRILFLNKPELKINFNCEKYSPSSISKTRNVDQNRIFPINNILPPLLGKKKGRASDRAWAPVWQSQQVESHDGTRTYRPRTTVPAHVTHEMHQ